MKDEARKKEPVLNRKMFELSASRVQFRQKRFKCCLACVKNNKIHFLWFMFYMLQHKSNELRIVLFMNWAETTKILYEKIMIIIKVKIKPSGVIKLHVILRVMVSS